MKRNLSILSGVLFFAALSSAQSPAGDAAKGKEIFEMCGGCHAADSDEQKMGPSLKGLFAREKMKNGQKPNEQSVTKIINEGGGGMPGYADILSAEEKAHVLAFLKTI